MGALQEFDLDEVADLEAEQRRDALGDHEAGRRRLDRDQVLVEHPPEIRTGRDA